MVHSTQPSTKRLTALIADDEHLARQRMRRLLRHEALTSLIYTLPQEACNGQETQQLICELRPDILFLDIHMPDTTGTALAQQIQQQDNPPFIIYCTAYDYHAIDAFRVGVANYLLKPIQHDQLKEAVQRVVEAHKNQQVTQSDPTIMLEVPSQKGIEYIHSDTIMCLHAEEKYTRIYHEQGSSLMAASLKSLENLLPNSFIRIHRKTLIALHATQALEKSEKHLWRVRLNNIEHTFAVSRRCLKSLRQAIKSMRANNN